MYGADEVSAKQREDFFNWCHSGKGEEFDYDVQLRAYCENDIQILAGGVIHFRDEFIKTTGCDPTDSATIAPAVLPAFQSNLLKPQTIAIPRLNNCNTEYMVFSHVSMQWLEYEAFPRKIFIRHALNVGEVEFGPSVDGCAELDGKKIIFESLGCYVHGCLQFYNPHDQSSLSQGCLSERTLSDTLKVFTNS